MENTINPKNAYPFLLPISLTYPKQNRTNFFNKKRKECRDQEKIRKQMMAQMLINLDKTQKLKEINQQNKLGQSLNKIFSKSTKCSICDGIIPAGGFMRKCECCDWTLCSKCAKLQSYALKDKTVIEIPFCQFCEIVFVKFCKIL